MMHGVAYALVNWVIIGPDYNLFDTSSPFY